MLVLVFKKKNTNEPSLQFTLKAAQYYHTLDGTHFNFQCMVTIVLFAL